jgi:Flp pilus assembly protein TadD
LRLVLRVSLALALAACTAAGPEAPVAADASGAADVAALLAKGDAAHAAGAPDTLALYRRAAEAAPADPRPLLRLGAVLSERKQWTEAADAYQGALALAPDEVEAEHGLGAALLADGRAEAALAPLEKAHAARPGDPRIAEALGLANDQLGRYDRAQAAYESGLRTTPRHLGLETRLGLSRAAAGDYRAAFDPLAAVAADAGATQEHRRNLARVLALAGDRSRAVAVLQPDMGAAAAAQAVAQYASLRALPAETRAAAILGFGRRAPALATPTPTAPDSGRSAAEAPAKGWLVQAGAFKSEKAAQDLAAKLAASGLAFNVTVGGTGLYHVRSGPLPSWQAARDLARELQTRHIDDAFVSPLPRS